MNKIINNCKINFREFYYRNSNKLLGLVVINIILIIYHSFFINRFLPVQEGWFQYYSNLMTEGKIMYKDFYMYIPPAFPIQMHLLNILFKGSFILMRYYGLIERLILLSLIYWMLCKYFKPLYVTIAVAIGGVVYTSNLQDIVYGYYQTSLFICTVSLYFFIKYYENINYENKSLKLIRICSFLSGFSFLYKQSTGVIFPLVFIALLIFISLVEKRKIVKSVINYMIFYLLPIILCSIVLIKLDAFKPFIEQVFGGASSKGSLSTVLFGFIPRIISIKLIAMFSSVAILLIIVRLNAKKEMNKYAIYLLITTLVLIFTGTFIYTFKSNIKILVLNIINNKMILLFIIPLVISLISVYIVNKICKRKDSIYMIMYFLITISLMYVFINLATVNQIKLVGESAFYDMKRITAYFSFYVVFTLSLSNFLYLIFKKRPLYDNTLWIMCVGSAVLMYSHGMSGIIEEHAVSISMPLVICVLLNAMTPLFKLKNVIISYIGTILIMFTLLQKVIFPYNWWGWIEPPINEESSYAIDVKDLNGFKVSKRTKDSIETITKVIDENTDQSSNVYTFPHISIFNVLSNTYSIDTFAPVHYFDVCPDDIASEDAKKILNNPPDIIVWMNLGEDAWKLHEEIFRGGDRSGQRDIKDAVEKLTINDYVKILSIENIDIWKKK